MAIRSAFRHRSWFRYAFQVRGSVIPAISFRTFVCGLFGLIISVFHYQGMPVSVPVLASIIPNIVLGLMLVFRTNTAYERFWEGRKLWGGLVNTVRNLARQVWVVIVEQTPQDRQAKVTVLNLILAFAIATKLHLRQDTNREELRSLMSPERYERLITLHNPPLEVAAWIQDYLQQQYYRQCLSIYQLGTIQVSLNNLVDYLGGCERILKTPIPMAYAIHLKQLLLIYCLTLPFQVVSQLGWWTAPVVALTSFTLFGIEEIGIEIENPFGRDPNDLPLDQICDAMKRSIADLVNFTPESAQGFLPAIPLSPELENELP